MRIHIAYKKINTEIEMISTRTPMKRYYRTPKGKKVSHSRALVFDAPLRYEKLLEQEANLLETIRDEDVEVDVEAAGELIRKGSRLYVNRQLKPVYTFSIFDMIIRPSGEILERPHQVTEPNANTVIPLRVLGKKSQLFSPLDIATRFVISSSYFLSHTDGVSYQFLYDIAHKLAQEGKFARIQAYDPQTKEKSPLVLARGRQPYAAAFLEGRVRGEEYCLIFHLSNQELKTPEA